MKNKRDLELVTRLFGLQNMFRKIPNLMAYYLGNIDVLKEIGFKLFQKLHFANLCKPIHGVIITPVSPDPLNLETVKRKQRITQC